MSRANINSNIVDPLSHLQRMILDLVRFPLTQFDVPLGDVGVTPFARDVHVVMGDAM